MLHHFYVCTSRNQRFVWEECLKDEKSMCLRTGGAKYICGCLLRFDSEHSYCLHKITILFCKERHIKAYTKGNSDVCYSTNLCVFHCYQKSHNNIHERGKETYSDYSYTFMLITTLNVLIIINWYYLLRLVGTRFTQLKIQIKYLKCFLIKWQKSPMIRQQKKLNEKKKRNPWITIGLKSINIRDKMYK